MSIYYLSHFNRGKKVLNAKSQQGYLQCPDSAVENRTLHPSYCCSCSSQKQEQSEGRQVQFI